MINYNYAKIVDDELIYAPLLKDKLNYCYINNVSDYLENGYKKVYGDKKIDLQEGKILYVSHFEYDDYIYVLKDFFPNGWWWGDKYLNSSLMTNFSYYFMNYTDEEFKLSTPYGLDTSNGKNFSNMFRNSSIVNIKLLDLTNLETCDEMFDNCSNLETIECIKCNSLKTSLIHQSNLENCQNLTNVSFDGTLKMNSALNLGKTKLTLDSIINLLNALEDNTNEATQFSIGIHYSVYDIMTEEQKNIALNKNIRLYATA